MKTRINKLYQQQGMTLVELLVGLVIGLFLTGGVIFVVASSTRSYSVLNDSSRLQENARFAVEFIARDMRMAGYFGCSEKPVVNGLNVAAGNLYDAARDMDGFDNNGTQWKPSNLALTSDDLIAKDIKSGTDAITLRYANPNQIADVETEMTNPSDTINAEEGSDDYLFKTNNVVVASSCDGAEVIRATNNPSSSNNVIQHDTTSPPSGPANKSSALKGIYKPGTGEVLGYRAVRYFVSDASVSGVPTLYRQYVDVDGGPNEDELVEGVENMQLLYGEDTDGDNVPDSYVTAENVGSWNNVISIQIALLIRTIDEYGANSEIDLDTNTYNLLDVAAFDPPDLRVRRQVYTSTVMIRNRK